MKNLKDNLFYGVLGLVSIGFITFFVVTVVLGSWQEKANYMSNLNDFTTKSASYLKDKNFPSENVLNSKRQLHKEQNSQIEQLRSFLIGSDSLLEALFIKEKARSMKLEDWNSIQEKVRREEINKEAYKTTFFERYTKKIFDLKNELEKNNIVLKSPKDDIRTSFLEKAYIEGLVSKGNITLHTAHKYFWIQAWVTQTMISTGVKEFEKIRFYEEKEFGETEEDKVTSIPKPEKFFDDQCETINFLVIVYLDEESVYNFLSHLINYKMPIPTFLKDELPDKFDNFCIPIRIHSMYIQKADNETVSVMVEVLDKEYNQKEWPRDADKNKEEYKKAEKKLKKPLVKLTVVAKAIDCNLKK